MGSLGGKIALVTGASRGIGKGCALELAEAGATVYVSSRSVEPRGSLLTGTLTQTVEEIEAAGGRGIAVACDFSKDDQVRALFDRIRDDAGGLDILVHSAFVDPGIENSPPFWETPLSWYDTLCDVGTRGAYVAAACAVPLMLARGGGLIVHVSSMGAAHFFQHVAYGMGKAALDKLTKDAGRQLRTHEIAVVSIWPYFVKTEAVLKLVSEGSEIPLEGAESQRFVGRGVVAIAADPDRMERSGKAFTSRELADAYGFLDVDGKLPTGSPPPRR
ncbi:MAG: SDR family NAD(P)-dependent oxidoreductase [Deltaproteobacteria bacterium]|jgi:NAD(P)-dependent dehydrogenase (short-subunit alcohol dehydrogenase family)|nr:SDR family NAD(P)-dependent oxidoreductase [Deltaproteobacteria bacterium]